LVQNGGSDQSVRGRPISGVQVAVLRSKAGDGRRTTTSDEGQFNTSVPAPQTDEESVTVRFDSGDSDYASKDVSLALRRNRTTADMGIIFLKPAVSYRIKVKDDAAQPVRGASVEIVLASGKSFSAIPVDGTDDDGKCVVKVPEDVNQGDATLVARQGDREVKKVITLERNPAAQELRLGPSGAVPTGIAALETWRKKLAFLQDELAKTSDPAIKFTLQQQIEEAEGQIDALRKRQVPPRTDLGVNDKKERRTQDEGH
jgi:hypothetical protein